MSNNVNVPFVLPLLWVITVDVDNQTHLLIIYCCSRFIFNKKPQLIPQSTV